MSEISSKSMMDVVDNVINNYKVSIETLSKGSGIEENDINDFVNKGMFLDVELKNRGKFYNLISLLDGINCIDEDTRIILIAERLIEDYGISVEKLSLYSKVNIHKINNFINNKIPFEFEEMYKFSVVVLFLHFIFNSDKG